MVWAVSAHLLVVAALVVLWRLWQPDDRLEVGWAKRRGLLDLPIVALGAATTATLALVLEDLLPALGSTQPWGTTPARVVVLACTFWPLMLLVAVRQRLQRSFGTLFYGELLLSSMSGRHVEHLTEEARLYGEYKEYRGAGVKPGPDGIDFVPSIRDLQSQLNSSLNNDSVRSGFHFAPNLLWPAAIGLGAALTRRHVLDLVELSTTPLRWRAGTSAPTWGFDSVSVCARDSSGHASDATSGATSGLTCIIVELSDEGPVSEPAEWRLGRRVYVGCYPPESPRENSPESATPSRPPEGRVLVQTTPTGASAMSTFGHVHPAAAVDAVTQAIVDELRRTPTGPVLVAARMSKVVALAVGMRLGELHPHPWDRLVFLHFNPGPASWTPTRNHPEQPELTKIAHTLSHWAVTGPGQENTVPVTLVNLTAHRVRVLDDAGGETLAVEPSGVIARLAETVTPAAKLDVGGIDCPVSYVTYASTIENLPEAKPGVALIVSRVLAAAVPRDDLYFPGDEVRDSDGRIVGCRYLGQFPRIKKP